MLRTSTFGTLNESEKIRQSRLLAAETAAREVGPRLYQLVKPANQTGDWRFFVFGCQGNAKESQQKVAALMNKLSANPQMNPHFILVLGDNFYDWGVKSPDDRRFDTHFKQLYKNKPAFVLLGNHDRNLSSNAFLSPTKEDVGMYQIVHSYLPDENQTTVDDKKALYQKTSLALNELPLWNLPATFYSLLLDDIQLFCLDSSKYLTDYLQSLAYPEHTSNQASWLKTEVEQAKQAGKRIILAMHHPLFITGKREYHSDLAVYLSTPEINTIMAHFQLTNAKDYSYNDLLKMTLAEQKILPAIELVLAAHDHHLFYYNNKSSPSHPYPLCQITTGGGGGRLQSRFNFKEQAQHVGCSLKQHGVTLITCTANTIQFSIHTINQHHLAFTTRDCQPHRSYPDLLANGEKEKIETFCRIVKTAVDEYFTFIDDKQNKPKYNGQFFKKNVSHGHKGIHRVDEVWQYISAAVADDYRTTLATVYQKAILGGIPTNDNSFIVILNRQLMNHYQMNLESIVNREQLEADSLTDIDQLSPIHLPKNAEKSFFRRHALSIGMTTLTSTTLSAAGTLATGLTLLKVPATLLSVSSLAFFGSVIGLSAGFAISISGAAAYDCYYRRQHQTNHDIENTPLLTDEQKEPVLFLREDEESDDDEEDEENKTPETETIRPSQPTLISFNQNHFTLYTSTSCPSNNDSFLHTMTEHVTTPHPSSSYSK